MTDQSATDDNDVAITIDHDDDGSRSGSRGRRCPKEGVAACARIAILARLPDPVPSYLPHCFFISSTPLLTRRARVVKMEEVRRF
jgi:hypothetical protein